MVGPTIEKLTGMGLLGKRDSIKTEILYLRDDAKREDYFNKFKNHNKDVEELRQVKWGIDSSPTSCGIRCNANVVLMQVGAKIPQSADGTRVAKEVPPVIKYPMEALTEWGNEYLTSSHTKYKGYDRVLISEPSKMLVNRYFEYLPKKIHETQRDVCEKFAADNRDDNPGLEARFVTIKYILLRCNVAMDHRGDVEEHTWQTHGVNIDELELEANIQVNEGETLVLSAALNFKELPLEGRRQVFDSWFDALAANGTVTRVESKENAKIQRHKAGNFLKALKGSIGNDFFNKVYYQLTRQLKESNDLFLGFTCRWSTFVTATEDALGPLANVK